MAVSIKTTAEIEKMRVAGRLAADVLTMIEPHVVAGITTDELDKICHDYIVDPRPFKLSWLSKIDLYLRQSCYLSWHS